MNKELHDAISNALGEQLEFNRTITECLLELKGRVSQLETDNQALASQLAACALPHTYHGLN